MDNIVVDKVEVSTESSLLDLKGWGTPVLIALLIILVMAVAYYKGGDGFTSADSTVARRSQNQKRSDTEVDRVWNLKELERSVALINRKAET